jgi:hypothetical protein
VPCVVLLVAGCPFLRLAHVGARISRRQFPVAATRRLPS